MAGPIGPLHRLNMPMLATALCSAHQDVGDLACNVAQYAADSLLSFESSVLTMSASEPSHPRRICIDGLRKRSLPALPPRAVFWLRLGGHDGRVSLAHFVPHRLILASGAYAGSDQQATAPV